MVSVFNSHCQSARFNDVVFLFSIINDETLFNGTNIIMSQEDRIGISPPTKRIRV